jgi:hypothetical protein
MILGLSFGKKKQTSNNKTEIDKLETALSNESKSTTGTRSGTSTSTTTGNQTTTGTTTGSSTMNQQQADRGTQSQTGTTTTLGADVQAGLSNAVMSLLAGGVNDANIANISNMIAGRSGFNADQFVADTVLGARTRGEQTLQETNAARESAIGGTAGTNSMAALLANRGRNDLEANIAQITAATQAQAQGIVNQNLAAAVGAQGSLSEQAAGLGQTLKGATTTVDQKTLTDQLSQLLGTQTQQTAMNQNVASSQTQNTATTELLSEILNAITSGTNRTVGTENSTGTNKISGGGLSLSL